MSWQQWADELRQNPQQGVADLLRGAADIGPFERAAPHEFLLAVLPRYSRSSYKELLGEPHLDTSGANTVADLPAHLDAGLSAWLLMQSQAPLPSSRKLGAYSAQVCEALQWPLYFALPQTRVLLQSNRAQWIRWLASITLSAYRDPEYDYWQVLASHQIDDQLQFFWQSFIVEAGRTRSIRYLNLGLLALAKLPLSEDDSLHNLRLQVQALIARYQRRKGLGVLALEELTQALRNVMARNPSLSAVHYQAFLTTLMSPLGDDKTASVLSFLGLSKVQSLQRQSSTYIPVYKLEPPGNTEETDRVVQVIRQSRNLMQAWQSTRPLLGAHEDYMHKSGDAYYFIRNLDRCTRALCEKYALRDPEIQSRLFHWIYLALRVDSNDPRLWMLWQLALRQAGYLQRAQWVLWEMIRRFPDSLPCRVELARLLSTSESSDDQLQAQRLLQQVLKLDPNHRHAHSTLAQLATRNGDWSLALTHAKEGIRIDPSDSASAVLLASAYARRNEPQDLQTAIEHLQRFVIHNPGKLKAEDYLRKLVQRQRLALKGEQTGYYQDKEESASTNTAPSESDPAWRAFAESIHTWMMASSLEGAASDSGYPFLKDHVLPLPQALRLAVMQRQLNTDVLDCYDLATQQEFPLEIRLWRYLQALQFGSSERGQAKQDLQEWLETEIRVSASDSLSWIRYLRQHLEALNESEDVALTAGMEWLKDLLDRYQPLPAPVLV